VALETPYSEIDVEIRSLVWLMNQWQGIETSGSCAGHAWPSPEAGICFTVDTQEHLAAFLLALPPLQWQGGFVANQAQWSALWLTLAMSNGKVIYSLKMDGYPHHVQRALIGSIEAKLKESLSANGHFASDSSCLADAGLLSRNASSLSQVCIPPHAAHGPKEFCDKCAESKAC